MNKNVLDLCTGVGKLLLGSLDVFVVVLVVDVVVEVLCKVLVVDVEVVVLVFGRVVVLRVVVGDFVVALPWICVVVVKTCFVVVGEFVIFLFIIVVDKRTFVVVESWVVFFKIWDFTVACVVFALSCFAVDFATLNVLLILGFVVTIANAEVILTKLVFGVPFEDETAVVLSKLSIKTPVETTLDVLGILVVIFKVLVGISPSILEFIIVVVLVEGLFVGAAAVAEESIKESVVGFWVCAILVVVVDFMVVVVVFIVVVVGFLVVVGGFLVVVVGFLVVVVVFLVVVVGFLVVVVGFLVVVVGFLVEEVTTLGRQLPLVTLISSIAMSLVKLGPTIPWILRSSDDDDLSGCTFTFTSNHELSCDPESSHSKSFVLSEKFSFENTCNVPVPAPHMWAKNVKQYFPALRSGRVISEMSPGFLGVEDSI